MTGITATEARSNLYRLIDETAESHQPIVIMGKRKKAVLVSRKIGSQSRKHVICSLYPVCGSLFVRVWKSRWVNAMRSWTGDMEVGLHQASPERCKEVNLQRPQTKSSGTVSADSE
ncbi:type II toxin-antitoxin system Phd/YefM family antitoxin [Halomonas ventosae]|uniref:type II toxin-antitoxin system Phd/YefM family antitoxin n=1 Tax=Halomonas ventosae TaxID=229007 RepID=UPI003D7695EA